MHWNYFVNRPTGVKIAIGMVLLVVLAGAVGGVGLYGTFRLGDTIDLTENSARILVHVNGAGTAVDSFLETGDPSKIESAKSFLSESLSTLDLLGEGDPVLVRTREAIDNFDLAVDKLVTATDVIKSAGSSQRASLAALDASAQMTLSEAQNKSVAAEEAATSANDLVQKIREMMLSSGVIQANGYRANNQLLQARETGNSKLIRQAKIGIAGMAKHVQAIAESDNTQLEKVRSSLTSSYEQLTSLAAQLDPLIADPDVNPISSSLQLIDDISKELDKVADVATRSYFDFNKVLSEAETNVRRADFVRQEAEFAASTGNTVSLMTKRLEAATSEFELKHTDENLAKVSGILNEAEEIGQTLSRAGANDVAELFAGYDKSFISFADATRNLDAALTEVRESSIAATGSISSLIARQAELSRLDRRNAVWAVVAGLIIALLAAGLVAVVLTRLIGRPIAGLTSSMLRLADGDTGIELAKSKRRDEIGRMMDAVLVFRDNALERDRLAEIQREEEAAQTRRNEYISELIANFRQDVEERVAAVNANAEEMENTAANLAMVSDGAMGHAGQVNQATGDSLQSVTTVASAAEELTASIAEIGRQAESAKGVVTAASAAASSMSGRIEELLQSANRIGDVVELIKEIAEQTDLLALNATIEAARGGEAGKGFAVVAAEVKSLASQTAGASGEIVEQVAAIQAATRYAVDSIREIADTMQEANEVTATIASAVIEQESATSEISNSAHTAAQGSRGAAKEIEELLEAVRTTASAADDVLRSSRDVNGHSQKLRESIETFLENVGRN